MPREQKNKRPTVVLLLAAVACNRSTTDAKGACSASTTSSDCESCPSEFARKAACSKCF